MKLKVSQYIDASESSELFPAKIELVHRANDQWAIRINGCCVNKFLELEWEPIPSARDDEFISRTRFSESKVMEIYQKYKKKYK